MSVQRIPFLRHDGIAAPIIIDNVDTDQIIPSREMKTVSRDGLGEALFAGWRYTAPGNREANPEFVLNKRAYQRASIILGGQNFGCGSSREHAVWALREFGILSIIAPSFGEIFFGNCIRNGILPIIADHGAVATLARYVDGDPQKNLIHIDLPQQNVCINGEESFGFGFEIDAYAKRLLTEGLDPIGFTLTRKADIDSFLSEDSKRRPWIYA